MAPPVGARAKTIYPAPFNVPTPATVWVVEMGMPRAIAINTATALPSSAVLRSVVDRRL